MGLIYKNGICYGGGGGGEGSSSLADLSDVHFTNLKPGDFLVHLNSGNWINKSKEDLKLVTEDDELTASQIAELLSLIN